MSKALMIFFLWLTLALNLSLAQFFEEDQDKAEYYFQKPGELVFIKGTVIKGKVERPQVMIIIQKEKIKKTEKKLKRSFRKEILKPLNDDAFQLD